MASIDKIKIRTFILDRINIIESGLSKCIASPKIESIRASVRNSLSQMAPDQDIHTELKQPTVMPKDIFNN